MRTKIIYYKTGKCENCKKIRKLVRSGICPAYVCKKCEDKMFSACMNAFFSKHG